MLFGLNYLKIKVKMDLFKKKSSWKLGGNHIRVCSKCRDNLFKCTNKKLLRLGKKSKKDLFHCVFCKKKLTLNLNLENLKIKKENGI